MTTYTGNDGLTYDFTNNVLTISGNGAITSLVNGRLNNATYLTSMTTCVVGDGITSICDNAFNGCGYLVTVTLPTAGLQSIGSRAFFNCTRLETINLPDTLVVLSGQMMANCHALRAIHIGSAITSFSSNCFSGCESIETITSNNEWLITDGRAVYFVGAGSKILYLYARGSSYTEFEIPDTVKSIGQYAFQGSKNLVQVVIPNSVTSIDSSAFDGCKVLASVTMSENVTALPDYCFSNCEALTSNPMQSGMTSIGSNCFYHCLSLQNITIPNTVTTIGSYAFCYCTGVISLTIPDSVTSMAEGAFTYCTALTDLKLSENCPTLSESVFLDCHSLTKIVIPAGVTKIMNYAFGSCYNVKKIVFNTQSSPTSTILFYAYAFQLGTSSHKALNCVVNSVLGSSTTFLNSYRGSASNTTFVYAPFPSVYTGSDGLTYVSDTYSSGSYSLDISGTGPMESLNRGVLTLSNNSTVNLVGKMQYVTIHEGVTSISDHAFNDGRYMVGISIPSTVTSIGAYAVYNKTATICSVNLSNVTYVGDYAFYNCYNFTFTMNASGVRIGEYAFYRCYNTSSSFVLTQVQDVGDYAFYSCSGAPITIGFDDSTVYIGPYAFNGCYNLYLTTGLPSSLQTLGEYAFASSSITSVTIPGSVEYVGEGAFNNCYDLQSAVISEGVIEVSRYMFATCNYLESVSLPSTLTTIGESAFQDCCSIGSVTIPNSVTTIDAYAFSRCSSASIYFGTGLIEVGYRAFESCSAITDLTINATAIDDEAFGDCTGLETVIFGSNVEVLGNGVFIGCNALESIYVSPSNQYFYSDGYILLNKSRTSLILCPPQYDVGGVYRAPNTLTRIEAGAFAGNEYLERIDLYDGLEYIGDYAFYECTSLAHIDIPDSVTNLGYDGDGCVFLGCTSLSEVTIGNGVNYICMDLFGGCTSLTEITIPSQIEAIENYAFEGCCSVTNIYFNAPASTMEYIGYRSFELSDWELWEPVYCTVFCAPGTGWSAGFLDQYTGGNTFFTYTELPPPTYIGSDGLNYVYDTRNGKKTLTVTGEGEMWSLYYGELEYESGGGGGDEPERGFGYLDMSDMTEVIIGEGIISVGGYSFYNCEYLKKVTLPSTLQAINESSFVRTGITRITLPKGLQYIGGSAFYECFFLGEIVFLPPKIITDGGGGGGDISLQKSRVLVIDNPDEPTDEEGVYIDYMAFDLGGSNGHFGEVRCDVGYQSDQLAEGFLDGYAGDYTVFSYSRTVEEYEYLTHNDHKIQVDSAIRDGEGRRIDTNYAKKVVQYNMVSTGPVEYITVHHTLGDIPSSVQLYIYDEDRQVYEMFMADIYATESVIIVDFSELDPEMNPLQEGVTYYIKALI